jgi:hypothetical protein
MSTMGMEGGQRNGFPIARALPMYDRTQNHASISME